MYNCDKYTSRSQTMSGAEIEAKIGKYHHRLELIRTFVPCIVLVIQLAIFVKLFFIHN